MSIVMNAEYQQLPKGIRRLLVVSEEHFFEEPKLDSLKWVSRLLERWQNGSVVGQPGPNEVVELNGEEPRLQRV